MFWLVGFGGGGRARRAGRGLFGQTEKHEPFCAGCSFGFPLAKLGFSREMPYSFRTFFSVLEHFRPFLDDFCIL